MDEDLIPLVLDGDVCRQMNRYHGPSDIREAYRNNIHKTVLVEQAHVDFLRAGANIIRTNSYHALLPFLRTILQETEDYCTDILHFAALNAQNAVNIYSRKWNIPRHEFSIIGSCGCFDDLYLNRLRPDDLKNAHRHRMRWLEHCGVDLFALEGIRSFDEGDMFLDLMKEFPDMQALMIFDLDRLKNIFSDTAQIAEQISCYYLQSPFLDAVGVTSSNDVDAMYFLSEINMKRNRLDTIPLVLCTNNYCEVTQPVEEQNNSFYISHMEYVQCGIRYIGGGFGVYPEEINSFRRKISCYPMYPFESSKVMIT